MGNMSPLNGKYESVKWEIDPLQIPQFRSGKQVVKMG